MTDDSFRNLLQFFPRVVGGVEGALEVSVEAPKAQNYISIITLDELELSASRLFLNYKYYLFVQKLSFEKIRQMSIVMLGGFIVHAQQ